MIESFSFRVLLVVVALGSVGLLAAWSPGGHRSQAMNPLALSPSVRPVSLVSLAESHAGSQSVGNENPAGSSAPSQTAVPAGSDSNSLLRVLFGGSWLGDVVVSLILLLSLVSVYFIVDHAITINRRRIMPKAVLDELERLIIHGETQRAAEFCRQSKNTSLATEVVLAGLDRFHNNEFGFAEYRSACEEAGEDQTGRLYRRTEVLNVIGSIAPMLGLTGTVLGMIEAFNIIAAREGMAQPQELAGGIGEALITTLLGLFVAIPTMIALSFFRARIDSLVSEASKRIEQVMMPLGRKKPLKRGEADGRS